MKAAFSELDPHLKPLEFLVGGTFRADSGTHTVRYQLAMGGTGIRGESSFSSGTRGESVIYWDAGRQTIAVSSTTSNGTPLHGVAKIIGNHYVVHAKTPGWAGGVSELLSNVEFMSNDSYRITVKQRVYGQWRQALSDTYHREIRGNPGEIRDTSHIPK